MAAHANAGVAEEADGIEAEAARDRLQLRRLPREYRLLPKQLFL